MADSRAGNVYLHDGELTDLALMEPVAPEGLHLRVGRRNHDRLARAGFFSMTEPTNVFVPRTPPRGRRTANSLRWFRPAQPGRLFLFLGGFAAGVVVALTALAVTVPERIASLIERVQGAVAVQLVCEPEEVTRRPCLWVRHDGGR